jgi:hypothetical protein
MLQTFDGIHLTYFSVLQLFSSILLLEALLLVALR